jgi:hypothetical protein
VKPEAKVPPGTPISSPKLAYLQGCTQQQQQQKPTNRLLVQTLTAAVKKVKEN